MPVRAEWHGRLAETAAKYSDNAPMAAVCCNACRTCVTTNVLTLAGGIALGAACVVARFARRLIIH
jgi:hypothetical protein